MRSRFYLSTKKKHRRSCKRVYQHSIESADIKPEKIHASFPPEKYQIIDRGETSITTNYK